MTGSQPLHYIKPIALNDTFLELYTRVNDSISVINAIHLYDIKATGGVLHKRRVAGTDYSGNQTVLEILELNFANTGSAGEYGYGIDLINLSSPISNAEGGTYAIRLNHNYLQYSQPFIGISGATVSVEDYDLVTIGASGSRGDGQYRPLKVYAKDSLPYNIDGSHRFRGDVYFDGSKVVINAAQLHVDDNLLFLASSGNSDDPSNASGLTNDLGLGGGSGSGIVIKGLSGDKSFVFRKSDGVGTYYSFYNSENFEIAQNKGFVSSNGTFKLIGISGSAPSLALRTAGQDALVNPVGWKIYQSVTGDSVGTLKIKREGITDIDALELFPNSEVKIGTIYAGTGGNGSFQTEAAQFSIPATRNKQVLHHSWLNRDVLELKATADSGMFAEPISSFKAGTVLTFNALGQYKKAKWNANPSDGYKDAEVVGIIEKIVTDDYILQVPVTGSSYSTSMFSKNEMVSLVGGGKTVKGYIYDDLPASGLSGIKVFVDALPSGLTKGWFTASTGLFFVGGATLKGSADEDLVGICGSFGITATDVNNAVIVRQGVFDIPETGQGATGYDLITSRGLSAGYLFYLGENGGVTYSTGNLFDPEQFYKSGSNVAKPLFVYLGNVDGKKLGMFQHYQGLGLTYSITSYNLQPLYMNADTQEIVNFDLIGEAGNRNKILNSGFDVWTRLDALGNTYSGYDSAITKGLTFNVTTRNEYPFGSTYDTLETNALLQAGYIADGYFFDTYSVPGNFRQMEISRQQVSSTLPSTTTKPVYELKVKQIGDVAGKTRLYAIVPDHRTLSDTDMNLSFYAKHDHSSAIGITVGIAYVWKTGSTYAKIENYHAFNNIISTGLGTAVTGGTFDRYLTNLTSSYQRYTYAFSSESLNYTGANGDKDSFVAPFIEIGSLPNTKSIYVTGFQLSKGMTPKPYEKRSAALEKTECDRFFQNIVIANGGYYPIFTGNSGPSIFAGANLSIPLAETPTVKKALDIVYQGVVGASSGDPLNIRKNSISILRNTDTQSSTYHRYFESVYSLDASGFSGTVASRLVRLA
jgi:hypothetical protein